MTDIEQIEANTLALGGSVVSGPLCTVILEKSPDMAYSSEAVEPSTRSFLSYEKFQHQDKWVFEQFPRGGYAPYSVTYPNTAEMRAITQAFVDTGTFEMDGVTYVPENTQP